MIESMFILAVIFTCLYMFKGALNLAEKQKKGGKTVRKLFILLAFLFLLPLPVLAADDYTCTVCYEPAEKIKCETLMSKTLEGVQNMVIAATESKSGLDKVTVDCSFPDRTVKGYSGYIAEIKLRK